MNEPEKRIVITEVYGGCRNIRITDEGTYCAAYPHGGWEKIEPDACDHCQREKYLSGISRAEAIKKIASAIKNCEEVKNGYDEVQMLGDTPDILAKAVLNAILDK